jgi:hypothetical protein
VRFVAALNVIPRHFYKISMGMVLRLIYIFGSSGRWERDS